MAIHILAGTTRIGVGVFWRDCVHVNGWRVQHNGTLRPGEALQPYRLVGPDHCLWASADALSDFDAVLGALAYHGEAPTTTKEIQRWLAESVTSAH
ncbi:hypothetical protein [Ideonella margarita]|uniref:Uncharacterized protein n=1 Tax=Ideonella margarita TaxID=2984191 RepID=A0ABU9CA64_9BURK